ncbi:8416_t:CDS:2 [Ambispora gerdemannii]|uniref:8416_t:CDS:1 n=1 Tax=Ambispora gerdemannii TaxID=144530 RepID=A0A9N9B2T0_9GLOM|nr:8416_t:CDS:2 [Ambispora gerdemannii]
MTSKPAIIILLFAIFCLLSHVAHAAVQADNHKNNVIRRQEHHDDETLPVFRLHCPDGINKDRVIDLARSLYGISNYTIKYIDSRIILRSGSHVVEVDTVSGGIWTADEASLWNTSIRPELVSDEHASEIINNLIHNHTLLPKFDEDEPFQLVSGKIGGSLLGQQSIVNGSRITHKLDTRTSYRITVNLPKKPHIPIIGGGAKFQFVLGEAGRLIGFNGVWRQPERKNFEVKIIPKKETDKIFLDKFKHQKLVNFTSSLAYFSAPSSRTQQHLYPVYVYDGTLMKQIPQQSRSHNKTKNEKRLNSRNNLTCGTEWIGESGGLGGSHDNALGFVNGLYDDGWDVSFNWGDFNAFKSDWTTDNDDLIDNVDFVFYTGHANGDGWVLDGGNSFLTFNEIGLLDRDLEWLVIAACGPLQDDVISPGGGDVFRWEPAFKGGLHLLLGYASVSYDNTDEGRLLTQYVREGQTVINAWFRAAQAIQPSDIWVGAMWVSSPSSDPSQDHIWDSGSFSADPINFNSMNALWTYC